MVKLELDEKRTHEFMYGRKTVTSKPSAGDPTATPVTTTKPKRKKLECVIAGRGDPHVVLISGYGVDMDYSWAKIFPELKKICRVIAYNRWGVGRTSKLSPTTSGDDKTKPTSRYPSQTGKEIINVLRRLLSLEEVHAPYVVVGHSVGGVYAQLFARLYPNEVAGMVLVDSSFPEEYSMKKDAKLDLISRKSIDGMTKLFMDEIRNVTTSTKTTTTATTTKSRNNGNNYEDDVDASYDDDDDDDDEQYCYSSEINSFAETAEQVRQAPPFPASIPLVVVSAGQLPPSLFIGHKYRAVVREVQESLAKDLSPTKARHVVASNKTRHFVQNDQPDLVLQAIKEVIADVRMDQNRKIPTPRTIEKKPI